MGAITKYGDTIEAESAILSVSQSGEPTMATATPPSAPESNGHVETLPPLPNGLMRLGELRTRSAAKDPYSAYRPFVGKDIVLLTVSIDAEAKRGTLTFAPLSAVTIDEDGSVSAPEGLIVSAGIPKSAIKALAQGARTNPDVTVVCRVEQSKRGIALR